MAFKLKSFKELVAMTKEKLDESLIPLRVKSARNRAEAETLKLEEKLLTLESKINEECSKKDLDFTKAIDLMDDYALTERQLKQIRDLVASLFPEE